MEVPIIEISCFSCGVSFWITVAHNRELINCHNSFYCPNGHRQSYVVKSDAEKLKECQEELQNVKRWRATESRSTTALRGVITRMKNKQKGA